MARLSPFDKLRVRMGDKLRTDSIPLILSLSKDEIIARL